jgi:hypothetical protein
MADQDWLSQLPIFHVLDGSNPAPASQPGNWLTSGLQKGTGELYAGIGHTIQAAGTVLGVPDVVQGGLGKRLGDNSAAWAQQASRPDIDALPWYHPERIAYNIAQMVPTLALAGFGGEALGGIKALSGAGTLASAARAAPFMIPGAVGSNVEQEEAQHPGALSQAGAAKALALGIPEGAAMGFMPGKLGQIMKDGAVGGPAKRAFTNAAVVGGYQGVLAAGQTAVSQEAYAPEMPAPDRARKIVDAGLSAVMMGGVLGGAFGALHPKMVDMQGTPPSGVTPDDMSAVVDAATKSQPAPVRPGTMGLPLAGLPPEEAQKMYTRPPGSLPAGAAPGWRPPEEWLNNPPIGHGLPAPDGTPLLEAPTPVSDMSDADLNARQEALRGRAEKPARGAIPAGLGRLQKAEYAEINQEFARRTPPGATPGIGFVIPNYTPEEVAAREPEVNQFKESVLADLTKQQQMWAAKNPFFQNLNAKDPYEMVSALKDYVNDADASNKDVPGYLQKIAEKYGVMKDGLPSDPQVVLKELNDQNDRLQADQAAAKTKEDFLRVKRANDALKPELAAAQAMADLHAEAGLRLDALKKPIAPEPTEAPDAVQEPSTAGVHVQPAPGVGEGVRGSDAQGKEAPAEVAPGDARLPHWEQYAQDHPEVATAPEGLEPNLTAPDGGRVLRDLTGEEAKLPPAPTHVEPLLAKSEPIAGRAGQPPTIPGDLQHSDPKVVQAAVDTVKQFRDEQRARLQAIRDAEPNSVWQAYADKALASDRLGHGDPDAVRRAINAFAARDDIEGRTVRAAAPLTAFEAQGVESPKDQPPSWATGHAAELGGDVAYHDADHALIRGHNMLGQDLYVPVDRATGQRTKFSLDDTTAPWMTEPVKAKLVAARDQYIKSQKTDPDGPFKGATDKVVGTPSADPRVVGYVSRLMRMLGLGNTRVLIVHPGDVHGQAGDDLQLNGAYAPARTAGMDGAQLGHMRQFGPDQKDFYIYMRPGMSDVRTVEAASHEVGHIVQRVALHNASDAVQSAVRRAYDAYFRATTGATMQDIVRMTRNREMAMELDDPSWARPVDSAHAAYFKYLTGFDEWFADNVSRWATTAEKPLSAVQKFFSAVAQRMREFITAVTGQKFMPNDAVKDFLDHMQPDSDMGWLAQRKLMGGGQIPIEPPEMRAARSVQDMEKDVGDFIKSADGLTKRAAGMGSEWWANLRGASRRALAMATDGQSLANIWAKKFAEGKAYYEASNTRDNVLDKANKGFTPGIRAVREFIKTPGGKAMWGQIQQYLIDSQRLPKDDPGLKSQLDSIRTQGGKPILDGYLMDGQTSHYMRVAAQIQEVVDRHANDPVPFKPWATNPFLDYQAMADEHDNAVKNNTYWKRIANEGYGKLQLHLMTAADAAKAETDPKVAKVLAAANPDLKALSKQAGMALDQAAAGDYAPFRRSGKYFVAGKFAVDEAGKVKPGAIAAMRDALDKASFRNLHLMGGDDQSSIMSRVETQGQMESLAGVFRELQKAGHLGPELFVGRPESLDTSQGKAPAILQRLLDNSKEWIPEGMNAADAQVLRENITNQVLDGLPDHSFTKFLQPRNMVHGFDSDMLKAQALTLRSSVRTSVGLGTRGMMSTTMQAMRQRVLDAKSDPTLTDNERVAIHDIADEWMQREAYALHPLSNKLIDGVRAVMHTIMIGFSPVYTFTAMSQVPLVGLPELAKTHGFMKSSLHIAGATPDTVKTMAAVVRSPDGAEMGFRKSALEGKISANRLATLMDLDARGGLNSTFTRTMIEHGEDTGSPMQKAEHWANALGFGAEMTGRVTMAFAAADAYDAHPVKGMSRGDFVEKIVRDSQWDWSAQASSRLLSGYGPFGPYTKISLAFSSWHTKMVGKLYQEVISAAGARGPDAQKEAIKFLAVHAAMTTMVCGTLGLPLANAFAGVADKLAYGITGRDDIDTEGLYRTWLRTMFGKDVGEVLSKGLPRALGVDMSHLGDANLLPGTSILTDKRKFEDSSKDFYKSMAGSGAGEISNMYLGARDLMNGDYMRAAIKMLPEGFKGIAEAEYAREHGYINASGDRYNVQPSGADIAKMAFGLDPANLALYEDANRIKTGLLAQRQYRLQNINQHLLRAAQTGDNAGVQSWMQEAVKYQMDHPGLGSPAASFGRNLSRHLRQSMLAQAMGTPSGVKLPDLSLRNTLGFANPGQ